MATFNWPGFGVKSVSWSFDQPAQVNSSEWSGTRTVVSNPWHGKWSAKVELSTQQGDGAFRAARAFFTQLKGQVNTFHLPAVEAPQNSNTGETVATTAAQGAVSIALTGLTDALVIGNMITVNGQLLSLTSVGSLVAGAQTVGFMPALRGQATSGDAAQTAKPYALVALTDSSFTWGIGSWRRYGLSFTVEEAVGETDGASPTGDTWNAVFSGTSGGGTSIGGISVQQNGGPSYPATLLNFVGGSAVVVGSTATIGAFVTPQQYGAVADGTTDDSAAFIAAIAALKAYALNAGGGAYKGSPKLFIPAGDYYLGSTTLDINHTLMIEGEGSGRAPAPGYGCTHLRWADGVCGIRIQCFNTSGTSTVDVVQHDAAGSAYLKNFSMQGGYTSTNGASHALVVRSITYLDDILIRNWSGTGVLSWTGNVSAVNYGGNTSVSRYTGVKVEGCKIGFDTRGTDSNVIKVTNCEGYQCRQAGFIDDNGAGSNTYDTCHATANGVIGGSGCITQVSNAGNYYAVKWGQETGAATNAPTGTTADNTWWAYAGSGAVDTAHPTWVSGMSNLISGGDYVMLSNYPTILINCYSEGGGFSQLAVGTLAIGGTNLALSSQGGTCLVPESDGLALKRKHAGALLHLDGSDGATNGLDASDSTGAIGSLMWTSNNAGYVAGVGGGHRFSTLTAGVATLRCQIMYYGIDIPTGEAYYVNSLQVVGARGSAVTRISRTATAGSLPTADGSITIANAATPTVAELLEYCTELEAKLEELTAKFRAATGHGLIA
jgi:hypothetical protein